MTAGSVDVTLRVPLADGKLLATIDQIAEVHTRRYDGQFTELDLTIDRRRLGQLTGRHPSATVVRSER